MPLKNTKSTSENPCDICNSFATLSQSGIMCLICLTGELTNLEKKLHKIKVHLSCQDFIDLFQCLAPGCSDDPPSV